MTSVNTERHREFPHFVTRVRSVSDLPRYIRGYFTDHFAWRQPSQISPLFQFALDRDPNV